MNIEHELKFLGVQEAQTIQRIITLGGKLLKARHLLRRYTFDLPGGHSNAFVRVRDEGEYVTLTYKRHDENGVSELEEKVESFEKTKELLLCMGLQFTSYQENYRAAYMLDDTLITFDTWPGIPTFMEVEASTALNLSRVISLLEFDPAAGIVGAVNEIYLRFGIDIVHVPEITFQCVPTA